MNLAGLKFSQKHFSKFQKQQKPAKKDLLNF